MISVSLFIIVHGFFGGFDDVFGSDAELLEANLGRGRGAEG